MGKILVFGLLALGIWFVAYSQQTITRGPITVKTHEREGYKDIEIQTALTNYLFSTQGAVLKSVYLYFAPFGWKPLEIIPDTATDPKTLSRSFLEDAVFPLALYLGPLDEKDSYELEITQTEQPKELVLRFYKQLNGLTIEKRFTIYNDPYYAIDLELSLKNGSGSQMALEEGFRMVLGRGVGEGGKWEARYLFDGKRNVIMLGSEAYQSFDGLGFVSRDLVLFLKNESPEIRPFADQKTFGVKAERIVLAPGETKNFRFTLYAGRHKYLLLEHSGLARIESLSFYNQLLVPMIRLLDWLYQKTRNYGWAIMIFTLITRIVLFPLMRKQFYSMAKMHQHQLRDKIERLQQRYPNLLKLRQLHPKMSEDELRRRARENQQALHQKLTELYKKEGINPLSGCLPMLIQFPILIILWRAIMYSAERIHLSPGFLWMPDLSQSDPYYIIVVLTVIFMILQSKLTPTPGASGFQSQLFIWGMPILMGILLKDFPAGLWLYYFLTTALQVLQQLFINWEMSRKAPKGETVS